MNRHHTPARASDQAPAPTSALTSAPTSASAPASAQTPGQTPAPAPAQTPASTSASASASASALASASAPAQNSAPALLLSTAYCGPVPYFAAMARYGRVVMEQHENYIKQTYRNRCVILGSNGPLSLVIPVEQGRRPGLRIRDTRIVWYERWQVNHWRTISSAYRNSPYFDYYADEIHPFYEKKWDFLFDFNLEYLELLLDLTGLSASVGLQRRSAGDDDTAQWAPHTSSSGLQQRSAGDNDMAQRATHSSTVGLQQRSAGDEAPAQSARHSSFFELTEAFEQLPGPFLNLREAISPKVPVSTALPEYRDVPYTQVFEGKFPFMPGLSVLDLLFNTGPETPDILRRSWL